MISAAIILMTLVWAAVCVNVLARHAPFALIFYAGFAAAILIVSLRMA
jgi:hypothetical protein